MFLFTERDTKRKQRCARGTKLCAHDFGRPSHLFPDLYRRRIHIKQSHLVATPSSNTIHTDLGQEVYLEGPEQVRHHADGRCILNALEVIRTLCNDVVVQVWTGGFLCKATIDRGVTGVISWSNHHL